MKKLTEEQIVALSLTTSLMGIMVATAFYMARLMS